MAYNTILFNRVINNNRTININRSPEIAGKRVTIRSYFSPLRSEALGLQGRSEAIL